jgi:hypothetical protein
MASEVNRQIDSAEDFSLLFCYSRNVLTPACWSAPLISLAVAATTLHQTANQGQSRSVFRLDLPAASQLACALENHAFPTSALQSVKIALARAVFVQG